MPDHTTAATRKQCIFNSRSTGCLGTCSAAIHQQPRATRSTGLAIQSVVSAHNKAHPSLADATSKYATYSNPQSNLTQRFSGSILHTLIEQLVCDGLSKEVQTQQLALHAESGAMWSHLDADPQAVLAEFSQAALELKSFIASLLTPGQPPAFYREAPVALKYTQTSGDKMTLKPHFADIAVVQNGRVVAIVDLQFTMINTPDLVKLAVDKVAEAGNLYNDAKGELRNQHIRYIVIVYGSDTIRNFGYATSKAPNAITRTPIVRFKFMPKWVKQTTQKRVDQTEFDKLLLKGVVKINGLVIYSRKNEARFNFPVLVAPNRTFVGITVKDHLRLPPSFAASSFSLLSPEATSIKGQGGNFHNPFATWSITANPI